MFSMTYLPWLTKKTKADFRIEFYQRGNLFFRGKTRLVLRGEGAVKRLLVKKVKKNWYITRFFPRRLRYNGVAVYWFIVIPYVFLKISCWTI